MSSEQNTKTYFFTLILKSKPSPTPAPCPFPAEQNILTCIFVNSNECLTSFSPISSIINKEIFTINEMLENFFQLLSSIESKTYSWSFVKISGNFDQITLI